MRFALLALVGLLFVAGDASAFGWRRAAQQRQQQRQNFNGCNQQFHAPAVAFVAPVQQFHAQPVIAAPVIAVPVRGGHQFFAR